MLLGTDRKSGKISFDQKRRELLAINFRENCKQVGKAGVGDPHLFAVQNVVLAIRGKHGASAAVERVRSGRRFRKRVRSNDFSRRQLRQVFLFLFFGTEINDRQQSDATVGAPGGGESGVLGDVVGDNGGGDFVQFQSAVGFRYFNAAEAEVARLFQQVARDREVLMFDFLYLGQDFIDRELFRGLSNHLLLFSEVFRSKHVGSLPLFQQKATT